MPITLACPSCSKRFRARDESAGKRVKCPFCQAAVTVPAAGDDGAVAASPPAPPLFSPPPPAQSQGQTLQLPPEPALFDVVGKPPPPPPARPAAAPPPRKPITIDEDDDRPAPLFGMSDAVPKPGKPAAADKKVRPAVPTRPGKPAPPPEETAYRSWRKVKGGLGWVQFGLLFFALVGAVPFAKLVYERTQGPLPAGPGEEWVKIDGYLNTPGPDAVQLRQDELIDAGAFVLPILIGGLAVVYGRLTAGAAPRNSGAKGLFLFSGLAALVVLGGAGTDLVGEKQRFGEAAAYGRRSVEVAGVLGEFWFLLGLGAVAAALKRPAAVRAVGFAGFVLVAAVLVNQVGWKEYERLAPAQLGRPTPLDADWKLYEAAARMLGWLLVVGSYWRAIGGVKGAIRDHLGALRDAGKDGT